MSTLEVERGRDRKRVLTSGVNGGFDDGMEGLMVFILTEVQIVLSNNKNFMINFLLR